MKVILRNDIAGLGKRGDICDVKDGYARNFLFPSAQALLATDGAVTQAAAMRRRICFGNFTRRIRVSK